MKYSIGMVLFTIVISLCMTPLASARPKSLAEVAAKPDKVAKKVWFGPAHADMKKLHDIGMPKKVGLITFYIFDSGSSEFSAMRKVYGGTYSSIYGITEQTANEFASEFSEIAVPILKREFAAKGMELLTPNEFLDTPQKVTAYVHFELPKGGLQKATEATVNWLDRNPGAAGAADGYRMIPLHSSFLNKDVMFALEKLRQELDLDALVAFSHLTSGQKNVVIFSSAYLQMFGPNPQPLPDNKMQAKFWQPTIPYPSGTFGKGFKGVPFHKWKTRKVAETTEYEGYDVIVEAMSQRTLAELQKYYDKGR
jgi:hypothetical protein